MNYVCLHFCNISKTLNITFLVASGAVPAASSYFLRKAPLKDSSYLLHLRNSAAFFSHG